MAIFKTTKISILSLILFSATTFGNDGFYQGSGASLILVDNTQVKVLTEVLEITPIRVHKCYEVAIPPSAKAKNGELLDDAANHLVHCLSCLWDYGY